LVLLTGSQGVNGGGWAHYVGQEKVRPLEGFQQIAFANDWVKSPKLMNGTSFFYFATEQFRYEYDFDDRETDWGSQYSTMHPDDFNAMSARLGWLPSFPSLSQNTLDVMKDAREKNSDDKAVTDYIAKQLVDGDLEFAIEHPNDPRNFPRVFFNWRSNLLGDSGKGHEYFVKHLIGGDDSVLTDTKHSWQPEDIYVDEIPPEGKTDLFVSIDFRMTSS